MSSLGSVVALAGACFAFGVFLSTAGSAQPTSLWTQVAPTTARVQQSGLVRSVVPSNARSPIVLQQPTGARVNTEIPLSGYHGVEVVENHGLKVPVAVGLAGLLLAAGAALGALFQRPKAAPLDPIAMGSVPASYATMAVTSEKGDEQPMNISRRAMAPVMAGLVMGLNAMPATAAAVPLDKCLYSILRVQEACLQESRLIKTGLYKDVQRANVKLAVRMMIDNYKLSENFENAATYVTNPGQRASAGALGANIVDSLYVILEYFDSAIVDNLAVGEELYGNKRQVVLGGLDSAAAKIDEFAAFLPAKEVEAVRTLIREENELNQIEFKGEYLNPPPAI